MCLAHFDLLFVKESQLGGAPVVAELFWPRGEPQACLCQPLKQFLTTVQGFCLSQASSSPEGDCFLLRSSPEKSIQVCTFNEACTNPGTAQQMEPIDAMSFIGSGLCPGLVHPLLHGAATAL